MSRAFASILLASACGPSGHAAPLQQPPPPPSPQPSLAAPAPPPWQSDDPQCRGLCACSTERSVGAWQPTPQQTRATFHDALPLLAQTCQDYMAAHDGTADQLGSAIDGCLDRVSTGNVELQWCTQPGEYGRNCCAMQMTARELDGRRWIQIKYPLIGDYRTVVYELRGDAPQRVCDWYPWHAAVCGWELDMGECGGLSSEWPQLSAPTQELLCRGAEP